MLARTAGATSADRRQARPPRAADDADDGLRWSRRGDCASLQRCRGRRVEFLAGSTGRMARRRSTRWPSVCALAAPRRALLMTGRTADVDAAERRSVDGAGTAAGQRLEPGRVHGAHGPARRTGYEGRPLAWQTSSSTVSNTRRGVQPTASCRRPAISMASTPAWRPRKPRTPRPPRSLGNGGFTHAHRLADDESRHAWKSRACPRRRSARTGRTFPLSRRRGLHDLPDAGHLRAEPAAGTALGSAAPVRAGCASAATGSAESGNRADHTGGEPDVRADQRPSERAGHAARLRHRVDGRARGWRVSNRKLPIVNDAFDEVPIAVITLLLGHAAATLIADRPGDRRRAAIAITAPTADGMESETTTCWDGDGPR